VVTRLVVIKQNRILISHIIIYGAEVSWLLKKDEAIGRISVVKVATILTVLLDTPFLRSSRPDSKHIMKTDDRSKSVVFWLYRETRDSGIKSSIWKNR
jgi:hypothetical protein